MSCLQTEDTLFAIQSCNFRDLKHQISPFFIACSWSGHTYFISARSTRKGYEDSKIFPLGSYYFESALMIDDCKNKKLNAAIRGFLAGSMDALSDQVYVDEQFPELSTKPDEELEYAESAVVPSTTETNEDLSAAAFSSDAYATRSDVIGKQESESASNEDTAASVSGSDERIEGTARSEKQNNEDDDEEERKGNQDEQEDDQAEEEGKEESVQLSQSQEEQLLDSGTTTVSYTVNSSRNASLDGGYDEGLSESASRAIADMEARKEQQKQRSMVPNITLHYLTTIGDVKAVPNVNKELLFLGPSLLPKRRKVLK